MVFEDKSPPCFNLVWILWWHPSPVDTWVLFVESRFEIFAFDSIFPLVFFFWIVTIFFCCCVYLLCSNKHGQSFWILLLHGGYGFFFFFSCWLQLPFKIVQWKLFCTSVSRRWQEDTLLPFSGLDSPSVSPSLPPGLPDGEGKTPVCFNGISERFLKTCGVSFPNLGVGGRAFVPGNCRRGLGLLRPKTG